MGFADDFLEQLQREANRIEGEKMGKALTPDEIKMLQAADFLRKIAPWAPFVVEKK